MSSDGQRAKIPTTTEDDLGRGNQRQLTPTILSLRKIHERVEYFEPNRSRLESLPVTKSHLFGTTGDSESDAKIFYVPDSETGQQSAPRMQQHWTVPVNRHERPREQEFKTSSKWGESLYKDIHCCYRFFWRGGFSVFCSKGDIKQKFQHQGPVVRKVDNAIHRINHYPADSVVCFVDTYLLDSDLSGG